MRVFTVGHGARSIEALIATLARGPVACVADVRRFPGSRRSPWFGPEALDRSLAECGIERVWIEALGGRRKLDPRSRKNAAWQVEAFRAYANYLDTPEFEEAFEELLALAAARPTAILCAEVHPSRCHRRLIADKLWSLGHEVVHLIDPARVEVHRPPPFLRVVKNHLRYDVGSGR